MVWYRKRILKQRWKTETLFFWNAWDQCFLPEMLATFSSAHLRIVWEDINEPSLSKNNFSEGNTLLSFSLSLSPWNPSLDFANPCLQKLTARSDRGNRGGKEKENVANRTEGIRLGPVNGSLDFRGCLNCIHHDSSNVEDWLALS